MKAFPDSAGTSELYLNLLRKFTASNKGLLEELSGSLLAGDHEKARRLVHTLKGLSGTLGANLLFGAAEVLDDALKEKNINLDKEIKVFSAELKAVLDELEEKVGTGPEEQTETRENGGVLDTGLLKTETEKLRNLIEESDIDAVKTVEQILRMPGIAPFKVTFDRIRVLLRNFEFESALEAVAGLSIDGHTEN